jgi:hypothetical protein
MRSRPKMSHENDLGSFWNASPLASKRQRNTAQQFHIVCGICGLSRFNSTGHKEQSKEHSRQKWKPGGFPPIVLAKYGTAARQC